MCGPSDAEKSAQRDMADFSSLLRNNYQLLFNKQADVLTKLSASLDPTIAAGESQRGMSPEERRTREAEAVATSGAAAQQAEQAARTFSAGRGGGGTSGLVSGIDQQIQAGIASQGAQAEASRLGKITEEDYAIGRDKYWRTVGAENAIAGQYSPNAAMGGSIQGGEAAFGEAEKMKEQSDQWMSDVTALGTGMLGAAADMYGASKKG